jgi:glycosyltransferase involved in cell wall biosynthesis
VRVIIQIPCLDEESTLPDTVAALPTALPGVDNIDTVVVDDGSRDGTVRVAMELGVNHIVRFMANRGLARAFMAGLDACLGLGADIIVNTDADNQYCAEDIAKLIEPILAGRADMVVGCRPIEDIEHFSWFKKQLQRWGSRTVRRFSGLDVPDATSGFRAFSREAALQLNVISDFTYTIETLIQAGKKNIATACVPVRVNAPTRPSRLFRSIGGYLRRALPGMLRIYLTYQPLKVFGLIGSLVGLVGLVLLGRFLHYYAIGEGTGHVQSVVIGGVIGIIGFQILVIGLLADLISANRRLAEEALYRLRRRDAGKHSAIS